MKLRFTVRGLRQLSVLAATACLGFTSLAHGQYEDIVDTLNSHATVVGSEKIKSYQGIFDAFLTLDEPTFDLFEVYAGTVHPGMDEWPEVAAWAESGTELADAIIEAYKSRTIIFGLPYGKTNVPSNYQDAGLYVEIGRDASLRNIEFPYLDAVDLITTFCTAEIYRLLEAGQANRAMDLATAELLMLRQLCDRDFLDEKLFSIQMLSLALQNLRDMFYLYQEDIPYERYVDIAYVDLPYLRPDRSRLFMPEADRIVAQRLIEEVFNPATEQPDPAQFRAVFGAIQSQDEPLTRFGAAHRWENIASLHGSLASSMEKLTQVYDDWWKRWRLPAFDYMLAYESEFERTNEIRYAAVLYSIEDIQDVFEVRNKLICEVRGTALAAGVCAYTVRYDRKPSNRANLYGQVVRQSDDIDPFDIDENPYKFTKTSSRTAVDLVPEGRLWVPAGEVMIWSLGEDGLDQRGATHREYGVESDIIMWPPIKAMARQQGLMD